jgi:uncharacterized damage-inducible protein DinB
MISSFQLSRLYDQPEALEQILSKVPAELLEKQIRTGKWSIKENIAHLVRYQIESIDRFNRILTDEEPSLKRYIAEEDEEFPLTVSLPLNTLRMQLKEDRKQFHAILKSLTDDQLSRTGRHPVLGMLTLSEWIEFFLLHEAHHMMTIFQLAHA